MKRVNLLAFPSNLDDPPCYYRCLGPLAALRQTRPGLQVSVIQMVSWPSMCLGDVVLLQRPWSQESRQIAEMASRHGIPIWVDHDDDLFNIPQGNPAWSQYMGPNTQSTIAAILAMADVVTVSTQALAESVGRIRKATVVPNALMTNIVGIIPQHDGKPRARMVFWRGSGTHQRDLDRYTTEMIAVANDNPGVPWVFQGITQANYRLLGEIKGAQQLKVADPLVYQHDLATMRPKVMVVPLDDNPFNRAKSNIAWLEGTFAGAVVVAPDWPEWQKPGVLNYQPDNFAHVLNRAINLTDEEQNMLWKRSATFVSTNLGIHNVNRARDEVVDRLAGLRRNDEWRAGKRATVTGGLL